MTQHSSTHLEILFVAEARYVLGEKASTERSVAMAILRNDGADTAIDDGFMAGGILK